MDHITGITELTEPELRSILAAIRAVMTFAPIPARTEQYYLTLKSAGDKITRMMVECRSDLEKQNEK